MSRNFMRPMVRAAAWIEQPNARSSVRENRARTRVNLEQRYEVWIEADRALEKLPYDLRPGSRRA